MAQPLQTFSITAPGFYGLNTQDSSLDLASGYALVANNAVIDQYGRVGARKGWVAQHTLNSSLLTDVKTIAELVTKTGQSYVLCAGNNKLFKLVSGVLTELTYAGVSTPPVITNSNWDTASLSDDLYFYQLGHEPLGFDPDTSTTTYYKVTDEAGYNGTVQQANIVISALGRIWNAATTTDKSTVQWSDIKNPHKFGSGTAGTLDVTSVWPHDGDIITGLAVHNNFLFIFGTRHILVYSGAENPGTMTLADTVVGIGCIARDSVVDTGSDLVFLSETGVRSVMRTIQEKSAPFRDLSKNVRNDLMDAVNGEDKATIKSVYNSREGFYLLTLPILKTVYCFDTKATLQDGSARVTTWDSITPKSFCMKSDGTMLTGHTAYVGAYSGYLDNGVTYQFQYFTNHTDLGEPSVASILKKLSVVVIGGNSQTVTVKWGYDFSGDYQSQNTVIPEQGVAYYGVGEYGIASYSGGTSLQTLVAYPTGSGKVIQTGYESTINGAALSIQKIEIQAKNGKIS